MKYTKSHTNRLMDYLAKCDSNGCLPLEDWTTGRFSRYKSTRATPPFVKRYDKADDKLPYAVRCFFAQNPKRKAVYWLDHEKMFAFFGECARGHEL